MQFGPVVAWTGGGMVRLVRCGDGSAGGGSVGVRKVGPVMELGEVGLPNEFE